MFLQFCEKDKCSDEFNNKFNHEKYWKERAGARTEASVQGVFNAAVSFTTAGDTAEWGAILPEGLGKRFRMSRPSAASIGVHRADRRTGNEMFEELH